MIISLSQEWTTVSVTLTVGLKFTSRREHGKVGFLGSAHHKASFIIVCHYKDYILELPSKFRQVPHFE